MTTKKTIYDIAIIGGGINGMAIARDAAGRQLKTFLCDMGDFGSATSAWSSKFIHGGLRYLEFYEFNLVRKALKERDILMSLAPHMVCEQRFILPHKKGARPEWLIGLGLFLYDHLYMSKFMQRTNKTSLKDTSLKSEFKKGFEYSDATVDDHRLVIELAKEAQAKGAVLQNFHTCERVIQKEGLWHIYLKDKSGIEKIVLAKHIINATGPWVDSFLKDHIGIKTPKHLKLVKGSHIVAKKLYAENKAYTFQDDEGRVVFTVPYLEDYTLIGTTEEAFTGSPNEATINEDEKFYLSSITEEYFGQPLNKKNIVWTFSGVRPLIEEEDKDNRTTSRDYQLEHLQYSENAIINIWGGKLTTHRILAEDALNLLKNNLNISKNWTAEKPFQSAVTAKTFLSGILNQYPFLDEHIAKRLIHAYGKNILQILENTESLDDLGNHFAAGLYEKEVTYLIEHEWAKTPESVLFFRTKCGLFMTKEQIDNFRIKFQEIYNNIHNSKDETNQTTEPPAMAAPL